MVKRIDRQPESRFSSCLICGTWICEGCWDFRRPYALIALPQRCPRCGSDEGHFMITRHWFRSDHRNGHIPARRTPFVIQKVVKS